MRLSFRLRAWLAQRLFFPLRGAEVAADVEDYAYPWGDPLRYGAVVAYLERGDRPPTSGV